MASPEEKIAKLTCPSCKHTFSSSRNLYKHYKPFTDHRPEGKPLIRWQEAADESLDVNLSPYQGKPDLQSILTEGSLMKSFYLAFPSAARQNGANKPIHVGN